MRSVIVCACVLACSGKVEPSEPVRWVEPELVIEEPVAQVALIWHFAMPKPEVSSAQTIQPRWDYAATWCRLDVSVDGPDGARLRFLDGTQRPAIVEVDGVERWSGRGLP